MAYGLTTSLQCIGVLLFLACGWVAARDLPKKWAYLIAAIRVATCVAYFAWFYDGTWTVQDDFIYAEHGRYLIDSGYSPLAFLTSEGRDTLHQLAGSRHILYNYWNLLWMWILGPHYYAPVLGNVLLTFVAGHVFGKMLGQMNLPKNYRQFAIAFYLLHWDTVAWSSLIDLKDVLVQFLTIVAFYCVAKTLNQPSRRTFALAALTIYLFTLIRFYLPVLFVMSICLWALIESKHAINVVIMLGVIAVGSLALPFHALIDAENPAILFTSMGRFLLTPRPLGIAPSYSFLFLPALAHWLFVVPAILGGFMLCRESSIARLLVIYFIVILLFYAAVDELQGVRHRYQVSFVLVLLQFHFVWRWKNPVVSPSSGDRSSSSEQASSLLSSGAPA